MFKVNVLGTLQGRQLECSIKTQLECSWDASPKFMRNWINSILLSGGTLKLYFKNVLVLDIIKCVKLTF